MKIGRGRMLVPLVVCLGLVFAGGFSGSPAAQQKGITVRLGTLAPSNSSYHHALKEMGEKWRDATGGNLRLVIYPDGRLGGEADMVRKMRAGQLNAGMLTVVGLVEIERSVACLQYMPMMFRSWEEVDYVRDKLGPQLEKRLLDKGFVVLFWGDAGWVRFFSKSAATRPQELKHMKIFAWAGDTYHVDLMKALGYQPVPLETSDIITALQTGMIEAAPLTPLFALAGQCDGPAPNMLALDWVPIVGAAVISKETWGEFPPAARESLKQAALAAGEKIRLRGRQENEEAVVAMKKRGLKVHPVTPEIEEEWRRMAELVYPELRGKMVPADMFDEVRRLLAAYRAEAKGNVR